MRTLVDANGDSGILISKQAKAHQTTQTPNNQSKATADETMNKAAMHRSADDMETFESFCQRLKRDDPSLTLLNWNNKGIGGILHCQMLAEAMRHNHHAVVLFLQQNQLRSMPHLGSAVQFLYLSGNTGIDLSTLTDAILRQGELRVLTLAHCDLEDADALIRLLSTCDTLLKLDISGNPKLWHRIPEILRAAQHLEHLDITGCLSDSETSISDDDSSLDRITKLVELRLLDGKLPARWRQCLELNRAGRRNWGNIDVPACLYPRILQKASKISPTAAFQLLKQRPDLLIGHPTP